jgi:hypothetical protein
MCEERWERGVYTDMDLPDLADVVSLRAAHQCYFEKDGKILFVRATKMDKLGFLEAMPLTKQPEKPGYYTWIVYSSDKYGVDKELVCCKVMSILELGTIHRAIAYRVTASTIHAAGEAFVDSDGKVYFNFMSGTYMRDALDKSGKKRSRCDADQLEDFLIEKLREPSYFGPDAQWRSRVFITKEVLPITDEELELYKKFGADVRLFDDAASCEKARFGGTRRRLLRRYRKKRHAITFKRPKRK